MVIISETSPLTALLLVGRGDLLTALFDRVVIPPAVEAELLCAHTALPVWLEVAAPKGIPTSVLDGGLDAGETEAIALALKFHPDTLLMDERLGRRLAQRHGLAVNCAMLLYRPDGISFAPTVIDCRYRTNHSHRKKSSQTCSLLMSKGQKNRPARASASPLPSRGSGMVRAL